MWYKGTSDAHAGALTAKPRPSTNTPARSSVGFSMATQPSNAKAPKELRKTKKKNTPRLGRSVFLGFEEKTVTPAKPGVLKLQKEAWLIRLGA